MAGAGTAVAKIRKTDVPKGYRKPTVQQLTHFREYHIQCHIEANDHHIMIHLASKCELDDKCPLPGKIRTRTCPKWPCF